MNSKYFDVSRWMELANTNPEELEQFRLQEIERIIDSAPETIQKRLRGLQFQIDCKRRLHKNPLGACVAISRMMMDSLNDLNKAIQGELHRVDPAPEAASVLKFPAAMR